MPSIFLTTKRKKWLETSYRLIKAAIFISIVPALIFTAYVIYQRLDIFEAIYGFFATIINSLPFVWPYLQDLSALTRYVNKLANNQKSEPPALSFLSNVEELSDAVIKLQTSWAKKALDLQSSLAESKILFDTLPDILIMLDKNLQIIRGNKAAQQFFGKTIAELHVTELINAEMLRQNINLASERKQKVEFEFELHNHLNINKNFKVALYKFPVKTQDAIFMVMIMRDITESKKNERLFADFVANASHEIRTPLTTIIGMVETIQNMDESEHEAKKQFLNIVQDQSQRMNKLINDLLSLSKIERNEYEKPNSIIDFTLILDKVIEQLSFAAFARDIRIKLEKKDSPTHIIGDESEIEQVFVNLLSNAIKYSHDNNLVKIICGKFYHNKIGDAFYISFIDFGEGIAAEHLARLTERFYRIDKARSRKVGGTGLGLAIVKHIMRRHNGLLEIESEEGKGSKFTAIFPSG